MHLYRRELCLCVRARSIVRARVCVSTYFSVDSEIFINAELFTDKSDDGLIRHSIDIWSYHQRIYICNGRACSH